MAQSDLPHGNVWVCPSCKLTQFVNTSIACRRCRKRLPIFELEIPPHLIASRQEYLQKVLGKAVRELRLNRGYSQSTLAAKIQSHRTHVSRIECAQVAPSLVLLVRVAAALGAEGILIRLRG
jgi:ribosome-binding protein aMBF1 (putative translation factor)